MQLGRMQCIVMRQKRRSCTGEIHAGGWLAACNVSQTKARWRRELLLAPSFYISSFDGPSWYRLGIGHHSWRLNDLSNNIRFHYEDNSFHSDFLNVS
jgi:hypothetical protein